jgi:phosphatidylglycerophosphatase A
VNRVLLFIAQGFGIGRIPFAPGTFGSILGLGWFALLLAAANIPLFVGGIVVGLALSVWLCGAGERILGRKDPGSVVWDEIAAIPLCFLAWTIVVASKTGACPAPAYFFSRDHLLGTVGVFAAFRLFDVWKPWPIRQSQALAGGWGVTIDDALAAVYVNVVTLLVLLR